MDDYEGWYAPGFGSGVGFYIFKIRGGPSYISGSGAGIEAWRGDGCGCGADSWKGGGSGAEGYLRVGAPVTEYREDI